MGAEKYYGKYRARVVDTNDPQQRGRIIVECPRVFDTYRSKWCEPSGSFAYEGHGDFALPKVNDTVWIEFEEGDCNQPIWTHGWFGQGNTPLKNTQNGEDDPGASKLSYDDREKTRVINFEDKFIILHREYIRIYIDGTESYILMTPEKTTISARNLDINVVDEMTTTVGGDITTTSTGKSIYFNAPTGGEEAHNEGWGRVEITTGEDITLNFRQVVDDEHKPPTFPASETFG